jgi:biotin carboxyl carrier protein
MKMEIGAASEKGGMVKSILVKPDEMVEEGQVVAIVET